MADDLKPGRDRPDRRCCAEEDDVQRAANERAEQQAPEWEDEPAPRRRSLAERIRAEREKGGA